jgi:hypothetical protein
LKEERESSSETHLPLQVHHVVVEDFLLCSRQVTMVNTLNIEDRLEGETKFQTWKVKVLLLLEENDLKDFFRVWFQVLPIRRN